MEFLGIGPLEILFILVIALIILGPKDIVKTGRVVGKTLRKIVTSPTYQMVQNTSREIRELPNRLMRESGLDELQNELPKSTDIYPKTEWSEEDQNSLSEEKNTILKEEALAAWTTQPDQSQPAPAENSPENSRGGPVSSPESQGEGEESDPKTP